MDTQESSLYQIYLITAAVIVGLALYYIVSVLRSRSRFRRSFDARLEAEINKLESEKKRIAQDLHDEFSPVLTAVKMKLESVDAQGRKESEVIEKCVSYLEQLTSKIRHISTGLMPSVLQDKGLAIAIEQYIHNLGCPDKIDIQYSCDVLAPMTTEKSLHIFRIVQEIIHNSFKHAQATRLDIAIQQERNMIIIATADNGRGFLYDRSILAKHGYGLANIQNRIQSLNGNLQIDTQPGKGTRFYMEVPL